MFEIILYERENGRCPIKDYLRDLAKSGSDHDLTQIRSYIDRLTQCGMEINHTYPESIRPLRNDIYELRPGKHRVFFFYFYQNKIVLLHAYRKHGKRAPTNEIDKAIKEMKDYRERNKL